MKELAKGWFFENVRQNILIFFCFSLNPTPHHVSHVRCQVSRVTCQVSHVRCHLSGVMCHFFSSFFLLLFFLSFFGQSGGASRWRVCYQQGLPRLVFLWLKLSLFIKISINGITNKQKGKGKNKPCWRPCSAVRQMLYLKRAVRPKTGIIRATRESLAQQGVGWLHSTSASHPNETKPNQTKKPWKSTMELWEGGS